MPDNGVQDLNIAYPDLYVRITPYIDAIVKELRSQQLDLNMVDSVIQEIIKRSGLDIYRNAMGKAKSSMSIIDKNRYGEISRRTYPYANYSFPTEDIIRLLLLEKLWENESYYY